MTENREPATAGGPTLLTQLGTADAPDVYRRFDRLVGERAWNHRAAQIKAEIRGNPFLAAYLHAENEIAFGLERVGDVIRRYGQLPHDLSRARPLHSAISFAAQVLSMSELVSRVESSRFKKRVIGALKNPDDMRALRLELAVATHFARRGYRMEWPEMIGTGTYDLLVSDIGPSGLEVECKSISSDKGRSIHRREALTFHHLMEGGLGPIRDNLNVGVAVVLTVPGGLPTRHDERVALAKRVLRQITLGLSASFDDGSNIRIAEFDHTRLGDIRNEGHPEVAREIIDSVTSTRNRECMVTGTARGAFVLVLQSMLDDDPLDQTFRTLGDAARRQLTGSRAGTLIAGFEGIEGEQLISIAGQDDDPRQPPTSLAIKVSKFLNSDNRDHVVGVGFLSRGSLVPVEDGIVEAGGSAYYFPKRDSSLWHDDFSGIFRSHAMAQ